MPATTYELTKQESGFSPLVGGFSLLMEASTAEAASEIAVTVPAVSEVICYLYTKVNKPGNERWSHDIGAATNFVLEMNMGTYKSADVKASCRATRVSDQNAPMESGAWTNEQACDGDRLFSALTKQWADGDADDRLRFELKLRNTAGDSRAVSFKTGIGLPTMVTSPISENPILPDKIRLDAKLQRTIIVDSHI